jgi:hypothetical protein
MQIPSPTFGAWPRVGQDERVAALLRPLRPLLSVLAALSLVSCVEAPSASHVVTTDLGAVPSVAARICVVRPAAIATDVTMEVRDNGRLVAATRGKTFACWLAAPGPHQIRSDDDDTGPTFLHARPGNHYWLQQDVMTLGTALHAHLDWVDDHTATEMLRACDARVRVSVPGYEGRTDAVAVTPKL